MSAWCENVLISFLNFLKKEVLRVPLFLRCKLPQDKPNIRLGNRENLIVYFLLLNNLAIKGIFMIVKSIESGEENERS